MGIFDPLMDEPFVKVPALIGFSFLLSALLNFSPLAGALFNPQTISTSICTPVPSIPPFISGLFNAASWNLVTLCTYATAGIVPLLMWSFEFMFVILAIAIIGLVINDMRGG